MHNKNILVTGGNGFVGRNLVAELRKANSVEIVDRVTHINKDNYDLIFHLASNTDTRDNYEPAQANNVFEFSVIADVAKTHRTPVVYASSAAVYGHGSSKAVLHSVVESPMRPMNAYARSKALIETYASFFEGQFSNIGLRYFNVYGPGESHKTGYNSMIYQMIDCLKLGRPIKLFKYGEQKRDFIYVDDAVRYTIRAGDLVLESDFSTVYNVGSGSAVTFSKVADLLMKELGIFCDIDFIENPYGFFQSYTCADMSITNYVFNMTPQHDIASGIKEYLKNWGKP